MAKTIGILENFVRFMNYGDKATVVAGSILVILGHRIRCQSYMNNRRLTLQKNVTNNIMEKRQRDVQDIIKFVLFCLKDVS